MKELLPKETFILLICKSKCTKQIKETELICDSDKAMRVWDARGWWVEVEVEVEGWGGVGGVWGRHAVRKLKHGVSHWCLGEIQ